MSQYATSHQGLHTFVFLKAISALDIFSKVCSEYIFKAKRSLFVVILFVFPKIHFCRWVKVFRIIPEFKISRLNYQGTARK